MNEAHMKLGCLGFCFFILFACTGTSSPVVSVVGDTNASDVAVAVDLHVDLSSPPEVAEVSFPPDEFFIDVAADTVAETVGPQCAPGEGCFLDPCDENSDCQSGWCVQHLGESVCSQNCQDECPPGWGCQQVAGAVPDVVYICVSDYANLCRPCATSTDCTSTGGAEDACLDYGPDGDFCGGPCSEDADCPWGFSCGTTVTVDGVSTLQCVADAGVCPCTGKSIELALSTPCEVSNEYGTCTGQRACTEDGLSPCDALDPQGESCNGLDDDCDGDTDEPDLVDGSYLELCDDDNGCTADSCAGDEGCVNEILDSGSCEDNDPCTVADHCEAGTCMGEPVICDDKNPCTENICTENGGCEFPPVGGECDDDDPCTLGDHCTAGICAGEAVACDCQVDADCADLEDGDLCNGTLLCDTAEVPHLCVVEAGTEVTCPAPSGLHAFCLTAVCDPATGGCSEVPANPGLACDDDDACTVNEVCDNGVCGAGGPVNCNDGNPCTDDSCNPDDGCVTTSNAAPCNDDDVCTTGDQCEDGECSGGALLDCDDGDGCNGTESCDSAVGCLPGQPLVCDDGDVCNGAEGCNPNTGCTSGAALVCGDDNPCTDDTCSPDLGCTFTANAADCDDGDACTLDDHCKGGQCVATMEGSCNDDNVCTNDSCDPDQGCIHLLNQVPCDDGDVCTQSDHCSLGECIGAVALVCNDGNLCTEDSCDIETGCSFVPNAAACDDGNACTVDDACAGGWCKGGGQLDCDDANLCTNDACDLVAGCIHFDNALACEDGDACTVDDQCAGSNCVPGAPPDCDDKNLCTDDSCDPQIGCVNAANQEPCNDGNACTTNDTCADSSCAGGPAPDCEDDNVCTEDSCDPDVGCVNEKLTGTDCTDNSLCTDGDGCVAGECVPGPALDCDDGDYCTNDTCNAETGCDNETFTPCCGNGDLEAGEECDDGNQVDGDECSSQCELDGNLVPGNTTKIVTRQGFKIQCKDWSGDTCQEVWFVIPENAITQKAPCGVDDTTTLRPLWHGSVDDQCKTVCWIATGNQACLATGTGAKSGTASGWMYGSASGNVACDNDGRQYSQVAVPTVGNQVWSFDKVSWERSGSYSSYRCNW